MQAEVQILGQMPHSSHTPPLVEDMPGIGTKNKRFPSPLQWIAAQLELVNLSELENISLFCIPPWQQGLDAYIPEREEIKESNGLNLCGRLISKGRYGGRSLPLGKKMRQFS